MPIYSYKCPKCGNVFEKMEKASDNGKIARCESCNSQALRIFSPVGIIFKGSGFYSTDYKSSGSKASPVAKKPEEGNEKGDKPEKTPKPEKNSSKNDTKSK